MTKRTIPKELWIFPSNEHGHDGIHLNACFTKQCAMERMRHQNDQERYSVRTWRPETRQPVQFIAAPNGVPARHDAPDNAWFVMDLSNGSYYDTKDGHCYLWAFHSRAAARRYSRAMVARRVTGANVVPMSAPFRLYQSA